MKQRQLLRSDQAKAFVRQHKAPCSDCPWARKSLPGWLGPNSVNTWIQLAHSEQVIACHTRKQPNDEHWQCAGSAIYRANVCKSARDQSILQLPQNKVTVFSWGEFERHHGPALFAMGIDEDTSLEEA